MIKSASEAFPQSLRCLGPPLLLMLVGKESNHLLHTNTLCLGTHYTVFPNPAPAGLTRGGSSDTQGQCEGGGRRGDDRQTT